MSISYCTLHPTSHRMLIDISDVWERPGTMCARFAFCGMSAMSRLDLCVDLSFDPSGRLTEIGLFDGCKFITAVPCRKKCLVALVSAMSSCLDICITDVKYAVSICLFVRLLMLSFFVVIVIIGC